MFLCAVLAADGSVVPVPDRDAIQPESDGESAAARIKIVLADDHPVVRRGLRRCWTVRRASRWSPRRGTSRRRGAMYAAIIPRCWCSTSTCRVARASRRSRRAAPNRRRRRSSCSPCSQSRHLPVEAFAAGVIGLRAKEAADAESSRRCGAPRPARATQPPPGGPNCSRAAARSPRSSQTGRFEVLRMIVLGYTNYRSPRAVYLGANRRDPSCPYPTEAEAVSARRARPIRARPQTPGHLTPPARSGRRTA